MTIFNKGWVCVLAAAISLGAAFQATAAPTEAEHAEAISHGADAAAEVAAHGEAHEQPGLLTVDIGSAFWTIVLFVVLLFVLGKFVWPQILTGLKDRENKILGDLQQAETSAKQAERTLAEYHEKLAEAQEEARRLIDQAKADAQSLATQLKDQAQADITQARSRAQADIQAAKEQAISDLYAQAADIATGVASKILEREINPDDHRQLVDSSLEQMGKSMSA